VRLAQQAGNRTVAHALSGAPVRAGAVPLRVQRKHVLAEDQESANGQLAARFPGIKISGKLGPQDDAFWDRYMRRQSVPLTLPEFVESLLGGFLGPQQREKVQIEMFSEGSAAEAVESRGVRVSVNTAVPLSDKDSRPFSLTQVYLADEGRLKIHLEGVVAPGRGRQFVGTSLLAQAKALGGRKLTLSASSIGGSQEGVFAWARYGFVPTVKDWDEMRRWGLARLAGAEDDLAALHKAGVEEILLDPAPKAVRRLVYLAWEMKEPVTTFLNHLLSSHVSWKGELDLAEPESLRWIEAYAGGESLGQFTGLRPEASKELSPPPDVEDKEPELTDVGPTSFKLEDDDTAKLLADSIKSGDATWEDLEEEYGTKPEIIKKVRALLKKS
jgi:hypothetical protein